MDAAIASITINKPAHEIYETARDYQESFPDFMSDVLSVSIIESGCNYAVTEWEAEVDGTPIMWTEKDLFDDVNKIITWEQIEGDFDIYNGKWSFMQLDDKTEVILEIEYDFGIPTLTELIGPTIQQKVIENSKMMLTGLKDFCEKKSD